MPKIQINGIEELGVVMSRMAEDVEKALKAGIYDGAHEVFKEVEKQIRALPESDKKSMHRDITAEQKQGLLDGLYGSKMQVKDGSVHVYISFDGYNNVKTDKYPHGQPNIMIARSIESGGSYMNKRIFMTKAAMASRQKAVDALQRTFNKEISKLT